MEWLKKLSDAIDHIEKIWMGRYRMRRLPVLHAVLSIIFSACLLTWPESHWLSIFAAAG